MVGYSEIRTGGLNRVRSAGHVVISEEALARAKILILMNIWFIGLPWQMFYNLREWVCIQYICKGYLQKH